MEMKMITQIGDRMETNGIDTRRERIGGFVKETHPSRSFIFITGDDGMDYFCHVSQIQEGYEIIELRAGKRCTFLPAPGNDRGPAARLVQFTGVE
jgi:cold shock CspA family protein